MKKPVLAAIAGAAMTLFGVAAEAATTARLSFLSRFDNGTPAAGTAEIPAFDPVTDRVFVVNFVASSIDVFDLSNPAAPVFVDSISVAPLAGSVNSVAVKNGILAAALEAPVKTDPGLIAFYDTTTLGLISTAPAGALPDMVHFTANGTYAISANEGEPSDDYSVDPEGSVTIVDVTTPAAPVARQVSFRKFNRQADALRAAGVRLYGPGASVAQDLEPEYVSSTPNEALAYVSLQENNAIAVINLANGNVRSLSPLGFKDHSLPGNELDASDRDNTTSNGQPGVINIVNQPVFGMYQPDAIAAYSRAGVRYVVTANEGDARAYAGFNEESRLSASGYVLDPTVFPNAATLKGNGPNGIGRLNVTTALGDTDNDSDFDRIYAYGARSMSIFREDGTLVSDTGSDFESLTAQLSPTLFNMSNDDTTLDSRSDNKGPEPEGLALAQFGGRTFAFVGLERIGGVISYEITDPANPRYVEYVNPRTSLLPPLMGTDSGPEGLLYVPAADSPTRNGLLLVSNEISGTTNVYEVRLQVVR